MPLPKNAQNDQARIDERRGRVAALYLSGESQQAIGREVGVSQMTVSKDIAVLRARWRESAGRDFGAKVAEELARLDHLEGTLWDGWYRSCASAESRLTRTEKALKPLRLKNKDGSAPATAGRGSELIPVRVVTECVSTARVGDVRFLQEIRAVIDMRLKLMGAYPKEERVNNNVFVFDWEALAGGGPPTGPDPIEERIRAVEALALPAPSRNGPAPGTNGDGRD